MKKALLTLTALTVLIAVVSAQTPQSIPYQAVARDASGNLISNQTISLEFTVHQSTATGTVQYQETQSTTTNKLGLFSVNVGAGTVQSGSFAGITWGDNIAKFLQVRMDPSGGISYTDMGTTKMMSVPYALYAGSAGSAGGSAGGDLTGTYPNPTIGANKVTYGDIQKETNATLLGNNSGGLASPSEISLGSGLSLTGSTLNTVNNGTVTGVSVATANGFSGTSSGGATPALTLKTSVTGMLKGNGTAISAGTPGTDYSAGTSGLTTGILKSTTGTGALSIAAAGTDYQAPLSAGTGISISGGVVSNTGVISLANPSASIGMSAINGTATTAMRSDAAPAINAGITPTWTGTHTFSNGTYSALFTGGNVGIGTSTPGQALEVNGNISLPSSGGNKQIYTWAPSDGNWRIGMSASPGFTRVLATSHVEYLTFASGAGQGFALGDNVTGLASFEVTGSGSNYQSYFRGNVYTSGALTLGTGFSTGKIEIQLGPGTGADNQWHTVQLTNNSSYKMGMSALSIYCTGSYMDGNIQIQGIDLGSLLSGTTGWYGNAAGATSSGSFTNTFGTGADNQTHWAWCPDNYIASGIEIYANSQLDGGMKLRCSQLSSGYSTIETGAGVQSVYNFPDANADNFTHVGTCPAGTYVKGVSVYASSYLDTNLRAYCTGIKHN